MLVIIILLILYFSFTKKYDVIEGFEDKMDAFETYEEIYDSEFIDFYEIIYRNFLYIDYDLDIVYKKTMDEKNMQVANFMVAGCGVGKLCKRLKDKDLNVIGVDISELMLKKSQFYYPHIKFVRGNLIKQTILNKNSFSHIFMDYKTLYYNSLDDIKKIIINCYLWLEEGGFFIVPIYDPAKMRLVPRYYSSNYIDNIGNVHGFTYLNDFSHDCYIIKNEKEENTFDYYDKILFEDGKKRIKKTKYIIPSKEDMYDIILRSHFELFYKDEERPKNVSGYELAIFKRKSQIITVDELEKNRN